MTDGERHSGSIVVVGEPQSIPAIQLRSVLLFLTLAGCGVEAPPLSSEALQGDWGHHFGSTPYSIERGLGFVAHQVATVRSDSIRLFIGINTYGWRRFTVEGDSLIVVGLDPIYASVKGDTLRLAGTSYGGGTYEQSLIRLEAEPEASRPERIALTAGYCFGPCPSFDIEIDTSGVVRFHGRRRAELQGDHTSAGHRLLFSRLAESAAAVRADTTRAIESFDDGHQLALLVWYDGEVVVHRGSAIGFLHLNTLIADLADIPKAVSWEPSLEPQTFESREYAL